MSVRSPVAALTASESALSWLDSTAFRPLASRLAKSAPPAEPLGETSRPELGGVGSTGSAALIAPTAGTVMSAVLSDVDGGLVDVPGPVDHGSVGLEATLGHDQVAHLFAHVDVGHPHVSVGVGHRA